VTRRFRAYAIYGAFKLLRGYYVAFATDAAYVAPAPDKGAIYKILAMDWVPVLGGGASSSSSAGGRAGGAGASSVGLTPAEEEEEATYLRLLRQIADTKSFYFGHGYNITRSLQRNSRAGSSSGPGSSPSSSAAGASSSSASSAASAGSGALATSASGAESGAAATPSSFADGSPADEPFFWNRTAASSIIEARAFDFLTPVMNGFVGCAEASPNFNFTIVLISRRASARQGTRFNVRGADSDGNVANFVETEQVLLFGSGAVSSFVQIRGSIPVLWEQTPTGKYTPKCTLTDRKSSSQTVFQRHMEAQIARYGRVAAVNLIDQKGDQKRLGEEYESMCKWLGSQNLAYEWFDFHARCKKTWEALRDLTSKLEPVMAEEGFFLRDESGRVVSEQSGVLRTNCMDNLDRTNVVQSLFARRAALATVPGALEAARKSDSLLSSTFTVFDTRFNNLWADNADAVSLLYSGTGALKTDFTRSGKRTYIIGKKLAVGDLYDGWNSVQRYVINNFVDGRTQDAWDLFVGNFVPERIVHKGGAGAAAGGKMGGTSAIRAHMKEMTPVSEVVCFLGDACAG
jgi:hypothetical protein